MGASTSPNQPEASLGSPAGSLPATTSSICPWKVQGPTGPREGAGWCRRTSKIGGALVADLRLGALWSLLTSPLPWFGASLPLLLTGHLAVPGLGLAQSVPELVGECLCFALMESFFVDFLLFMARETGFPFLVTRRFPFEIYSRKQKQKRVKLKEKWWQCLCASYCCFLSPRRINIAQVVVREG